MKTIVEVEMVFPINSGIIQLLGQFQSTMNSFYLELKTNPVMLNCGELMELKMALIWSKKLTKMDPVGLLISFLWMRKEYYLALNLQQAQAVLNYGFLTVLKQELIWLGLRTVMAILSLSGLLSIMILCISWVALAVLAVIRKHYGELMELQMELIV